MARGTFLSTHSPGFWLPTPLVLSKISFWDPCSHMLVPHNPPSAKHWQTIPVRNVFSSNSQRTPQQTFKQCNILGSGLTVWQHNCVILALVIFLFFCWLFLPSQPSMAAPALDGTSTFQTGKRGKEISVSSQLVSHIHTHNFSPPKPQVNFFLSLAEARSHGHI